MLWLACSQSSPAVVAMLKTIFAQETAENARQQWASVADALRERFPKRLHHLSGHEPGILELIRKPAFSQKRRCPQ